MVSHKGNVVDNDEDIKKSGGQWQQRKHGAWITQRWGCRRQKINDKSKESIEGNKERWMCPGCQGWQSGQWRQRQQTTPTKTRRRRLWQWQWWWALRVKKVTIATRAMMAKGDDGDKAIQLTNLPLSYRAGATAAIAASTDRAKGFRWAWGMARAGGLIQFRWRRSCSWSRWWLVVLVFCYRLCLAVSGSELKN